MFVYSAVGSLSYFPLISVTLLLRELTPQVDYCEIPGDIRVRIRRETFVLSVSHGFQRGDWVGDGVN